MEEMALIKTALTVDRANSDPMFKAALLLIRDAYFMEQMYKQELLSLRNTVHGLRERVQKLEELEEQSEFVETVREMRSQ